MQLLPTKLCAKTTFVHFSTQLGGYIAFGGSPGSLSTDISVLTASNSRILEDWEKSSMRLHRLFSSRNGTIVTKFERTGYCLETHGGGLGWVRTGSFSSWEGSGHRTGLPYPRCGLPCVGNVSLTVPAVGIRYSV